MREYEGAAIICIARSIFCFEGRQQNRLKFVRGVLRTFDGGYDYYRQKLEEERLAEELAREEEELAARAAEKRAKQKEKERLKKQR